VAEHVTRRDLIQTRIVTDVVPAGKVFDQRRVEIELAGVNEFQDGISKQRFS
jgi:hypothetical protein